MSTRNIKFRGKREVDGEWVYGSLIITSNATNNPFQRTSYKERYQICQYDFGDWNMGGWSCYDVIPKTVGQFTGLKDKNGVDIYEGDILSIKETDFYKGGHHIVAFNVDSFISYSVLYNDINRANKYLLSYQLEYGNAQVIGNIHDNPELLT